MLLLEKSTGFSWNQGSLPSVSAWLINMFNKTVNTGPRTNSGTYCSCLWICLVDKRKCMFFTCTHAPQNIAVCQACCLSFLMPLPHSSATSHSTCGAPGGWAVKGTVEKNGLAQLSTLQVHRLKKKLKKEKKNNNNKQTRCRKDESKWLMEIVACFPRHTSFLPVRWPHLCTLKNLSRMSHLFYGCYVG